MTTEFKVTDPRKYEVTCTRQQWARHVVNKRPYMAEQKGEVLDAIESPHFICRDRNNPDRQCYYRMRKGKKTRWMKVVVEFNDEVGRLVTAFPADSGKEGEIMIWPESSD